MYACMDGSGLRFASSLKISHSIICLKTQKLIRRTVLERDALAQALAQALS